MWVTARRSQPLHRLWASLSRGGKLRSVSMLDGGLASPQAAAAPAPQAAAAAPAAAAKALAEVQN